MSYLLHVACFTSACATGALYAALAFTTGVSSHLAAGTALLYVAAGVFALLDRSVASTTFSFLAALGWLAIWWKSGGDDDFHQRRKRLAGKVKEVAGRLVIVPAPARASV